MRSKRNPKFIWNYFWGNEHFFNLMSCVHRCTFVGPSTSTRSLVSLLVASRTYEHMFRIEISPRTLESKVSARTLTLNFLTKWFSPDNLEVRFHHSSIVFMILIPCKLAYQGHMYLFVCTLHCLDTSCITYLILFVGINFDFKN